MLEYYTYYIYVLVMGRISCFVHSRMRMFSIKSIKLSISLWSSFESKKYVLLRDTMKLIMDFIWSEEKLNEIKNTIEILIKNCINKYVSDKRLQSEEDLLLWWKVKSIKFEILSAVSRKYISTPPTNVPIVRVFKEAELLYIPHRNKLLGKNPLL